MNVNGGAKGGRVGGEGFLFFYFISFSSLKRPIALWKQKCGCDEEKRREGADRGGKMESEKAKAQNDRWTSQGRQKKGQISGGR